VKATNIKVLSVPNYEGLTIDDFLKKAKNYHIMNSYLPEERDIHRLPRSFIINVLYTMIGEDIKLYVSRIIEERNKAVVDHQRMALELDDDIRRAFEMSTSISRKLHFVNFLPLDGLDPVGNGFSHLHVNHMTLVHDH
jgi:hypothetical protein